MTKHTSPLDSSHEIYLHTQISSNSEIIKNFTFFGATGVVNPKKNRIFEKNIENWELNWIKFIENDLNLKQDKINRLGAETDSNRSRTRGTTCATHLN